MKIVPFLGMFAGALSEPPPYPADRPGVPDRLAPSRSVPWPKPVPVPVAPLASVPDATLRRRARKGDREAVAEMGRRGRLDGLGLYRGTITEDAPADSAALVAALDMDTWSRPGEGDPCRPPCPGRLELLTGECSCYDSPPCSEHWLGCPVCGWEVPDSRPA